MEQEVDAQQEAYEVGLGHHTVTLSSVSTRTLPGRSMPCTHCTAARSEGLEEVLGLASASTGFNADEGRDTAAQGGEGARRGELLGASGAPGGSARPEAEESAEASDSWIPQATDKVSRGNCGHCIPE